MTTRLIVACLCVLGLPGASRARAPADRAWKILRDGAAHQHTDTRVAALHALGLLVKNDRARQLAESKLGDPEGEVRAAVAEASGQVALPSRCPRSKPR
jgi:HEAT repeats